MTNKANKAAATVETKSALVLAIVKFFKMDDGSKIEKFFGRIVKSDEREIARKNANLKTLKLQYDQEMDKCSDDIEDAQGDIEAAYQNVDLDRLKNNDSMDAYKDEYVGGIESAQEALAELEEEKKEIISIYKEKVKSIKKEIATLEDRDLKFKS